MKDEIKEILDFKENADYKKLSVDEILILKDYITNLQEEIEEEKRIEQKSLETINNLQEENERLAKEIDMWNDLYNIEFDKARKYKSRNEKAIAKLDSGYNVVDYDDTDFPRLIVDDAMDILQGSDKE